MKPVLFLTNLAIYLLLAVFVVDSIWGVMGGSGGHPLAAEIFKFIHVTPESPGAKLWFLFAGLLLVLLGVLLWIAQKTARPRPIQVATRGGETMWLYPAALQSFVDVLLENHPAVVSQDVYVTQTGDKGIRVRGTLNIRPNPSAPEVCHEVRELIREGFTRVWGIEKIEEIRLEINATRKSQKVLPGVAGTPEPAPEPPVRGSLESPVDLYDAPATEPPPRSVWSEADADTGSEESPSKSSEQSPRY